jgi:hypothetical protein
MVLGRVGVGGAPRANRGRLSFFASPAHEDDAFRSSTDDTRKAGLALTATASLPTVVGTRHLRRGDLTKLALGAVGVVYGDIRTSPLYAVKESRRWLRRARRASSTWRSVGRARRSFCHADPRPGPSAPASSSRLPKQVAPVPCRSPRRQLRRVQTSRRSRAPISPGALQASVSFTILRLYSTVNDRRLAFSVTSVSSPRDVIAVAVMMGSSLALLSKFPGRAVSLTLAERGRAGGARGARLALTRPCAIIRMIPPCLNRKLRVNSLS